MKVKFSFHDWLRVGKSVYNTEKGVDLSVNDFHSGTVFSGELVLDSEQELELRNALANGFTPTFRVYREDK